MSKLKGVWLHIGVKVTEINDIVFIWVLDKLTSNQFLRHWQGFFVLEAPFHGGAVDIHSTHSVSVLNMLFTDHDILFCIMGSNKAGLWT